MGKSKKKDFSVEPLTIEEYKEQNLSLKRSIGGMRTSYDQMRAKYEDLKHTYEESEKRRKEDETKYNAVLISLEATKSELVSTVQILKEGRKALEAIQKEMKEFNSMPWYKKMLYKF